MGAGATIHFLRKATLATSFVCFAMLSAVPSAVGQESEPEQPSSQPASADEAGAAAPQPEVTQLLTAKLADQEASIQALRADMERRLSEEHSARQAAEAELTAALKAQQEAAAALKASPKVGGSDGLTLSGFLQADMYVRQASEDQLNTSTGAPLNDNRFALKRGRLRASIDRRYLAAILEADFNTNSGPQMRPMNVEATAKWPGDGVPYVAATVGIFKIPFGYEIGQSDYLRLFAERSNMERALFPGEYDLGARLAGGWQFIRYALALQNGEPLGASGFPGRDPNNAKDVVGRLGMTSMLGEGIQIQGGFSALYGKGLHKGTSPTKSTMTWQDRNENGRMDPNELIVSPGTSGLPSMNFSRHALGADLLISAKTSRFGNTTAYGEILWAKNLDRALLVADPFGPIGRDMRERGYYVALTQDLGQYLQAGVRYDHYDPDQDSTDRIAASVYLSSQAVSTFGMALAVRGRVGGLSNRLLVQYDVNRNHNGRDVTGLPTNLANNAFTLRAEAVF
jgi:hypothetical protein